MKKCISFWQLILIVGTGNLWNNNNTAFANPTGELICKEDKGTTESGELQCSFRVDITKPMKDQQLKHCIDGVCVTAITSITEAEDDDPASTTITTSQSKNDNDRNEYDQEDDDDDDTLKIGMATYRKPFGNYYSVSISLWLHQAPKTSRRDDPLGWAEWCFTLGSLHVREGNNQKGEWYDLELAINVLQEAITLVDDHFQTIDAAGLSSTGDDDDVWESFRASVYSNLGEAYYLDPEMKHGTEALDHYEKALTIYQSLVEKHEQEPESTAEHHSTRHIYAMTLAKVGSALMFLHSAEPSGILDSIDKDLDGTTMSTTTTIYEDGGMKSTVDSDSINSDSRRGPKLQRASEVLMLAMEFYEEQCRQQLPDDYYSNIKRSRTTTTSIPNPAKYVEGCIDYATTLQYAATVESLSGNFQGSLDYMKRALLVYTGEKDILAETAANRLGFVDSVLSHVYAAWHRMGATESIGSMLVNIADTCGQLGRHEESKTNYKLAMRFYSKFHISPPPTARVGGGPMGGGSVSGAAADVVGEASMNDETKALLDSYLSMLKEYRRGTGMNADPNQAMYQQDDAYEGDILYNIGTMYIHSGDEKEGMEWFEEAVAVYQRTHKPGTYSKDRNKYNKNPRWSQIASMKASLTRMYFGQGRFNDSVRVHQECMDLFRELYGEGVNPYIQFLQEQVEQGGGGTEPPPSGDNGILGGRRGSETAINLENYLQSIKNATAEKLETLKDEEKKKKEEL